MPRPHLLQALRDRVLLCDGGMGSRVQALTLDVDKDYWGKENCTEVLNLSRPDLVREIHRGYYEAGADMVLTNSFGGSPITLGEFELTERAFEINKLAGELAREAAETARRTFEEGASGEQLPTLKVTGEIALVDALVGLGLAASKGEARRLIAGGGARIDGEKADMDVVIPVDGSVRISAGKKKHGLLVR